MMQMQTTRYLGGTEIRLGARWQEPIRELYLTSVVECVAVQPDSFVGRVELGGRVLVQGEPASTLVGARRQAQDKLVERLVALLADA